MKAKAYQVTISGSYRGAENKVYDYSDVKGVIPFTDEELATMHVRGRYAKMWIMRDAKKYKERIYSVRECHIDAMEVIEGDFSYLGKDIREMTQEELQDLATAKDLRSVPLYKVGSERDARTKAYAAYSQHILRKVVKYQETGFNLMKQPPIVVTDPSWRKDSTKKRSNDQIMEDEAVIGQPKTALSRDELEELATSMNVAFDEKISDQVLYKRIYG
jgi:hypothetical protein